jgi:hypothetical protein
MSQARPTNVADTEADARRRAVAGRGGGERRGFIAGATEARPGIITTEFWLCFLGAIAVVIAGYASDSFDNDLAWALFAGLIAAYALSRGFAKSGSREGPFVVSSRNED